MRTALFLILFTGVILNCGSQQAETAEKATPAAQTLTAEDSLYTSAARNLCGQFGGELLSTLNAALDENGPPYAIGVCQAEAPRIAADYSGAGWTVKRVSEKWRTVAGRPDSTETAVLASFADTTNRAESQIRWSGPDSARVFTYYQKIVIREMCLQCHGDIKEPDPDLWSQIRIQYPYDKATGYKLGELRGMFVIAAHVPTAAASAKRLAEGATMQEIIAGASK